MSVQGEGVIAQANYMCECVCMSECVHVCVCVCVHV